MDWLPEDHPINDALGELEQIAHEALDRDDYDTALQAIQLAGLPWTVGEE